MGRLAGLKYRQIIKKLKNLGFEFDRQAAGSHETWFNAATEKDTDSLLELVGMAEGPDDSSARDHDQILYGDKNVKT